MYKVGINNIRTTLTLDRQKQSWKCDENVFFLGTIVVGKCFVVGRIIGQNSFIDEGGVSFPARHIASQEIMVFMEIRLSERKWEEKIAENWC